MRAATLRVTLFPPLEVRSSFAKKLERLPGFHLRSIARGSVVLSEPRAIIPSRFAFPAGSGSLAVIGDQFPVSVGFREVCNHVLAGQVLGFLMPHVLGHVPP